jgi:integrase
MDIQKETPNLNKKPMYNEELKKEFIASRNKSNTGAAYALFRRIYDLEKSLGRDLNSFSLGEVEEIFRMSDSEIATNDYNTIKTYLDFCLEKGLIKKYVLNGANKKYFENILDENRLRITEEDLNKFIGICFNAQDKLILRLLFEGVNGERQSELFNLTVNDIDKSKNTLCLRCDKNGDRKLQVSNECISLIEETLKENAYYYNNGKESKRGYLYQYFHNNNFIIKYTKRRVKNENKRADRSLLTSRFPLYKEWFNQPKLTPTVIYQSGLINYAVRLSKSLGKHVSKFNHKEDWSRVAEHYPMKGKPVNGVFQYNPIFRYIRYDEIDILYGNYLNNNFELQFDDETEKELIEKKKRESAQKFRRMIIKSYNGKCSITDEDTLEALEACHIQDYVNDNSNHHQNGILLRADLHKLYDKRLLLIDEDYRVKISNNITSDYYKQFDGMKLRLPKDEANNPSKKALIFHNDRRIL